MSYGKLSFTAYTGQIWNQVHARDDYYILAISQSNYYSDNAFYSCQSPSPCSPSLISIGHATSQSGLAQVPW